MINSIYRYWLWYIYFSLNKNYTCFTDVCITSCWHEEILYCHIICCYWNTMKINEVYKRLIQMHIAPLLSVKSLSKKSLGFVSQWGLDSVSAVRLSCWLHTRAVWFGSDENKAVLWRTVTGTSFLNLLPRSTTPRVPHRLPVEHSFSATTVNK